MSRMMRGVALMLLLTLTGCSSLLVTPQTAPHYLYLGTAAIEIGVSDQGDTNEELTDAMAKSLGWWTTFRALEYGLQAAVGRELRWWERALFWILPTIVNVRGIFREFGRNDGLTNPVPRE